jgi:hypothetical protein
MFCDVTCKLGSISEPAIMAGVAQLFVTFNSSCWCIVFGEGGRCPANLGT